MTPAADVAAAVVAAPPLVRQDIVQEFLIWVFSEMIEAWLFPIYEIQ
jgi:hypothetical protein